MPRSRAAVRPARPARCRATVTDAADRLATASGRGCATSSGGPAATVGEFSDERDLALLTAADAVEDRLAGFDAEGDDYLVKPFSMAELLARVQALLRRSGALTSGSWQIGDLVLDDTAKTVTRGDHSIELTRTEYGLLCSLVQHAGRVLSKTQLLTQVWGFDAYDANLVEVHMSALRRKLEACGPRIIHTVRGAGYVMRA